MHTELRFGVLHRSLNLKSRSLCDHSPRLRACANHALKVILDVPNVVPNVRRNGSILDWDDGITKRTLKAGLNLKNQAIVALS